MKAIYLIGFMGAGKTSFGKTLAEAMNIPFYDLDLHIEESTGKKISALFEAWGDEAFRLYEAKVLREFSKIESPFVLACGGGTPCFHDSMKWINTLGHSLFLDTPFDEIMNRLKENQDDRPLYKRLVIGKNDEKLHQLYIQRREIYLQAASILGPETPNVNEVIHMLNS